MQCQHTSETYEPISPALVSYLSSLSPFTVYRSLHLLLLLLCAQSLPLVQAAQHIPGHHHKSPIGRNPRDVVPRANASSGVEVVTSAWYPSWGPVHPENISWNQYTHMVYAFGLTTPDPGNITGIDDDLLKDFLYFAKSNGVSPVLSIRGWSGAQYFFTAVATSDSRTQFIDAILALVSM